MPTIVHTGTVASPKVVYGQQPVHAASSRVRRANLILRNLTTAPPLTQPQIESIRSALDAHPVVEGLVK